jgi:hypothetical protein
MTLWPEHKMLGTNYSNFTAMAMNFLIRNNLFSSACGKLNTNSFAVAKLAAPILGPAFESLNCIRGSNDLTLD